MNPSIFFPNINAKTWQNVDWPNQQMPFMLCICPCQNKEPERVEMRNYQFRDPNKRQNFTCYVGVCKFCDTAYWSSENLKWILWLSEEQLLLSWLNQANIKYIHNIDSNLITIVGDTELRFHFRHGKFEKYVADEEWLVTHYIEQWFQNNIQYGCCVAFRIMKDYVEITFNRNKTIREMPIHPSLDREVIKKAIKNYWRMP